MESLEYTLNQQILPDIIEQKVLPELPSPVTYQSETSVESKSAIALLQEKSVQTSTQDEQAVTQKSLDFIAEQANHIPAGVATNSKVKHIIEALLFAAQQPMTVKQLHATFTELEAPKKQQIQEALDTLHDEYKGRGIGLHRVASGYRFQVKADMASWVARLFAEKPVKYSRALLETMAIIAYQQPVTRGDIEEIRGVSVSSQMLKTLLEREWIKALAHKEVPGRPALYGTTKEFLDYFNLPSLEAMPPLEELQVLALEGELKI